MYFCRAYKSRTIVYDPCLLRTVLFDRIPYRHRNALFSPVRKCRKSTGTLLCLWWSWGNVRTLVHGNHKYIFRTEIRHSSSGIIISFHFHVPSFTEKPNNSTQKSIILIPKQISLFKKQGQIQLIRVLPVPVSSCRSLDSSFHFHL